MITTIFYVLITVCVSIGWRRWRDVCSRLALARSTYYSLGVVYGCLLFTLICTSILSTGIWDDQWINSAHQRAVVWGLCMGAIVQTAGGGFVLTPLLMYRRG